jgi:hypothetical protein
MTTLVIETRDLYGRCPSAVAAFPRRRPPRLSLAKYLAAKTRLTVPYGVQITTYRIEGKSDLRLGAREGEKNAGVPEAGPLWPRPPGPLLWVGGWEIEVAIASSILVGMAGFPFFSVESPSAANAAHYSPFFA